MGFIGRIKEEFQVIQEGIRQLNPSGGTAVS